MNEAGVNRRLQIQELEELRLEAYDNSRMYKEKTKLFHDKLILRKQFSTSDKVLLYNSRLKLMPGKLKSCWIGPFIINKVFSYGAVKIQSEATGKIFTVNGHRLKIFHEGIDTNAGETMTLESPNYLSS